MSIQIPRIVTRIGYQSLSVATRSYHVPADYKFPSMDELPVPQGSFKEYNQKRQRRYNKQLYGGIIFFIVTVLIAKDGGIIFWNAGPPKESIEELVAREVAKLEKLKNVSELESNTE